MPWILPNLRNLVWRASTAAGLDRALLFLSPGVTSFSLELTVKVTRLDAFLREVASKAKLQEFSLTSPVALSASFVDVLHPQTKLQKLVLAVPEVLSSGLGRWASALPELQTLQLDLRGQPTVSVEVFFEHVHPRSGASTPNSVGGSTDSGVFTGGEEAVDFSDLRKSVMQLSGGDLRSKIAFSHLQNLHLSGDVSSVIVFLKHIDSGLTELDLVIEDPPENSDWAEMCSLICEKYHDTLSSLRVTATPASKFNDFARSPTRTEPPSNRVSLEHLGPLPALQRFEIDLPESVLFVGADVARLAAMCPNLEEVKLCPLSRFPALNGPPKLTLEQLSPLMACPNLHTIFAVVNAKPGSSSLFSSRHTSSNNLRRLHLGHSWITNSLQVAILISHLAPRLETLRWFHEKTRPGFIEANSRSWEAVQDTLPHLQDIRRHERQRSKELVDELRLSLPPTFVSPPPAPAPPPVETQEKSIDASVVSIDRAILVRPRVAEFSVQMSPVTEEQGVEATPSVHSVYIDASVVTSEVEVDATVKSVEQAVEAQPEYSSMEVDATPSEPELPPTLSKKPSHAPIKRASLPSIWALIAMVWKVCVTFPLSIPSRVVSLMLTPVRYSIGMLPGNRIGRSYSSSAEDSSSECESDGSQDISMEVVNVSK